MTPAVRISYSKFRNVIVVVGGSDERECFQDHRKLCFLDVFFAEGKAHFSLGPTKNFKGFSTHFYGCDEPCSASWLLAVCFRLLILLLYMLTYLI